MPFSGRVGRARPGAFLVGRTAEPVVGGGDETKNATDTASAIEAADIVRPASDVAAGSDVAVLDKPLDVAETIAASDVARVVKQPAAGFGPAPSVVGLDVQILYDGVDITSAVLIEASTFKTTAGGTPGPAFIALKDTEQDIEIRNGRPLELWVAGIRVWGGYVINVPRSYFFDGSIAPITSVPRRIGIYGVDNNILFAKRVLYDKATPTRMQLTTYPAGTADDIIIKQYVADHLDLSGDGVTVNLVEHVGTPSTDSDISGSAGWTWGEFMTFVSRNIGSLFYLDPDKALVYTDVDTPNAPFGISDRPGDGQIGCREIDITNAATKMANEALIWGAGQGSAGEVVLGHAKDQPSLADHNLWQTAQFLSSVYRQATVDRIADSIVYGSPQNKRGAKDDAVSVSCVVFEPGLRVGQKVAFESQVWGFSDVLPIRSMAISFPEGRARFLLEMSHEIDPPWSTTEFFFPNFDINVPSIRVPGIPQVEIPNLGIPPFDPCAPTCEGDLDTPLVGCVDTFTRVVADGLGSGEIDTWLASPGAWEVDGARVVVKRPADFFTKLGLITDHTILTPLCFGFDATFLARGSSSFLGGIVLILRKGGAVGSSRTYNAFTLRVNYFTPEDGGAIIEYSAFGDDRTLFFDRGHLAGGSLDLVVDTPYRFQLHCSNEALRLVITDLTTGTTVFDGELENSVTGGGEWHLDYVDQIELHNSTVTVDEHGTLIGAGEVVAYLDNLNVCCDEECGGFEPNTVGDLMGLFTGVTYTEDTDNVWRPRTRRYLVHCEFDDLWEVTADTSTSAKSDAGYHNQLNYTDANTTHPSPPGSNVAHDIELYHRQKTLVDLNTVGDFPDLATIQAMDAVRLKFTAQWILAGPSSLTVKIYANVAAAWPASFFFDGSPEPAEWTSGVLIGTVVLNSTRTDATWHYDDTVHEIEVAPGSFFTNDMLRIETDDTTPRLGLRIKNDSSSVFNALPLIASGSGGNPCGTVDEPDPDPPHGYTCEAMVDEIAPPTGRPPEDSYYQVRTSFRPASTRVWMQGKLLRYVYDYTEIYTEGIIEIDDAVIAAADPGPLDIYICYYAEPVFLGVV